MKYLRPPYTIIIVLFFIALFLRLYHLSTIPVGLHGDEISIGYNAFSLLKTGKDHDGKLLPTAIDQFGDFRPAGYHYVTIPFVALFDLNALAVRLPGALFGAITIILFYFFILELFEQKSIALFGSTILVFSPWHIVTSRSTSEGIIAGFFIIVALLAILKLIKTQTFTYGWNMLIIISSVSSFLLYHTARFFLPLFLIPFIALCLYHWKPNIHITKSILYSFIIIIVSLGTIFYTSQGKDRPVSISVFNIPGGERQLKQLMDEDGSQLPFFTRYFHNKVYFYGRLFLTSYFKHFDGDYLFVNNGFPIRYRVPWSGNLYIVELPFILFGFATLLYVGIKQKKIIYLIPIIWLALSAVPAGLTWEDIPNIQRSSLMLYSFAIITSIGLQEILNLSKKKVFIISIFTISVVMYSHNVSLFLHQYFHHLKTNEPWHRGAAVEELIATIEPLSKSNDIIMTTEGNNSVVHYLFYTKFDPATFHAMGSPRLGNEIKINSISIVNNRCPLLGEPLIFKQDQIGTIFVNREGCRLPKNTEMLKVINNPDGTPAFDIVKVIPFN